MDENKESTDQNVYAAQANSAPLVAPYVGSQIQLEPEKKNLILRRPTSTVFLGSLLATILGAFVAAPAAFDSQLGALSWTLPYLLIFCMLPLFIGSLISRFIAHIRHVTLSPATIWLPGLVFIPLLFFLGLFMANAFEMPKHGDSGSEFMPLVLIIIGISTFWIVPAISIIINLVITFRKV